MKWPIILIVFLVVPTVFANEITLSTDKSEYYFMLGEQAVVQLRLNNSYGQDISGMMGSTITQQINQQGTSFSSSNSNSQNFVVKNGSDVISLSLGISQNPAEITLDLGFDYNDPDGKKVEVTLKGVKVFFVQNEEDKKQDSQEKQSESKDEDQLREEQEQQQKEEQERREQQQQVQQQIQQNSNKLQNNQLNQDTSQLKKQMQKEVQEKQQTDQEFKKMLEQNQEISKAHQDMLEQGFNMTNSGFEALRNDTGSFKFEYNGINGTRAELKGVIENGTLANMSKEITEPEEDTDFGRFLGWPLILIIMMVVGFIIFMKYFKKGQSQETEKKIIEKKIDYLNYAKDLIKKAQKMFNDGKQKDAYEAVSRAIRFYLSHKHGLNKEVNNTEIVDFLRRKNMGYQKVQDCLNLCSMVEFAKYQTNKKDFDKIIEIVSKIVV